MVVKKQTLFKSELFSISTFSLQQTQLQKSVYVGKWMREMNEASS